ncbi:MAG: magnesium transporter [Pirellulales bacterium]|nr:magnesium transporter [Pirellulales bacterium]
MTNTLYLPELREMLAAANSDELREFCTALHPTRAAEFMEGLSPHEAWEVLQHADPQTRAEIFHYFDRDRQVEILEQEERAKVGQLIGDLAPDDRVDILNSVAPELVQELLPLVPDEERRDINRLRAYSEGTAGAMMTTDFARLSESLTVTQAIDAVRKQAEESETIYYLYVVDDQDHLRGLVSLRQLVLARPETPISELMERALVTVHAEDDQEEVARTVSRFDFQAIPVVDDERHLLGIVTYDDVIDVVQEEAAEDAQRIGAVAPLRRGYLETPLLLLSWKRGIWLSVLFVGATLTMYALKNYTDDIQNYPWLILFIPLVISTGGNSGSQSATLVITALSTGDITLLDWARVVRRELVTGVLLGSSLAVIGFGLALLEFPSWRMALTLPVTVVGVVMAGTLIGGILPLIFRRLGLDPAIMSNPFVSGIMDILGILIYMNVALEILRVFAPR